MDEDQLRYAVMGITLLLGFWIAGYAIYLRSKGIKANAVAERNSNTMQRALLGAAAVLDLYLIFRAPFPVLDRIVYALPTLGAFTAVIILVAGGFIIVASQTGMGSSWRVGVPKTENHIDELVTTGLHGVSRNPVYLGIMLFLIGAFVAAPGPLTAAGIVISYFGLTKIIRQEEFYLSERFGQRYEDYKKRVRRWI